MGVCVCVCMIMFVCVCLITLCVCGCVYHCVTACLSDFLFINYLLGFFLLECPCPLNDK